MNKDRIEGVADRGERAGNREALVIKGKRRRSGGRAVKECVLTWGDLVGPVEQGPALKAGGGRMAELRSPDDESHHQDGADVRDDDRRLPCQRQGRRQTSNSIALCLVQTF
jgi:hypothetical protein